MKFFLLINVKMPTIVNILTFMSGKSNILGLTAFLVQVLSTTYAEADHFMLQRFNDEDDLKAQVSLSVSYKCKFFVLC